MTEEGPSLRGFSTGDLQGYYAYLGTVELHIPLFYAFKGWNTKPFFLKGMYLNAFYDYAQGNTSGFNQMAIDGFLVSMGAELGLSTYLLYAAPIDIVAGYAYVQNTGESKFYYSVKVPLDFSGAAKKP